MIVSNESCEDEMKVVRRKAMKVVRRKAVRRKKMLWVS
jgi:hypothetical protein